MSYKAVIMKAKVKLHPNADKLKIINAGGWQIITGSNIQEDELICVFPCDGALSSEFCYENSEYREGKGVNKDLTKIGFFESNRRIKAIKLRGEISEAYAVPLSYLAYTGVDMQTLVDGYEFDTLNGHQICEKYYSPQTLREIGKQNAEGTLKFRFHCPDFPTHFDTAQLRNVIGKIPLGATLYWTLKQHGCVSGDTLIDTLEKGKLPIQDIVEQKLDVHIKALDITTNEIEYVTIDDYYHIQNDGEWYEITLEDGTKVEITGNNPVWLPALQAYRRVDELQEGDICLLDK